MFFYKKVCFAVSHFGLNKVLPVFSCCFLLLRVGVKCKESKFQVVSVYNYRLPKTQLKKDVGKAKEVKWPDN